MILIMIHDGLVNVQKEGITVSKAFLLPLLVHLELLHPVLSANWFQRLIALSVQLAIIVSLDIKMQCQALVMLGITALRGRQQKDQTLLMEAYVHLGFTVLNVHPGHNLVFQAHTTMQVVRQHARTVQQVFTAVATLQLP